MVSYIIVILALNFLQSHTKAARVLIIIAKVLEDDMDGEDEGSEDAESEETDVNSKHTNSEETDTSSENTNSDETDTSFENTNFEETDTCSENTNSKETDICSEYTTREDIDHRKNEDTKAFKTASAIETLEATVITEGADTTEKSGATKTDDTTEGADTTEKSGATKIDDTTEGSEDPVEAAELAEVDLDTQLAENMQLRNDSLLPFGCECDNFTRCMCCGHLEIPQLGLSKEACVRLSYNGDKIALTATFVVNGKDVFSKTISASNPPPLCFSFPPGNFIADLCFRFYDVQAKLDKLHTCLELNPRVLFKKITTINVGCFKFGMKLG
ncbi:hypothetical protein AVEN_242752-1 [Araneus ventricosus]|uniref:DUF4773 domain-containing protein n=1 Tax=Araneus ventricosus TaxID=182803 RepID=A0A4Y2NXC5_ARAVE|nr:hypothetical protein AVEN_242752-1 [Araneus ventricosus]